MGNGVDESQGIRDENLVRGRAASDGCITSSDTGLIQRCAAKNCSSEGSVANVGHDDDVSNGIADGHIAYSYWRARLASAEESETLHANVLGTGGLPSLYHAPFSHIPQEPSCPDALQQHAANLIERVKE